MTMNFVVYVELPDSGILTDMSGRPTLCVEVEKALRCGRILSSFRKLSYKVIWLGGADGNRYRLDLHITARFKDAETFERAFRKKAGACLPFTATMEEPAMVAKPSPPRPVDSEVRPVLKKRKPRPVRPSEPSKPEPVKTVRFGGKPSTGPGVSALQEMLFGKQA